MEIIYTIGHSVHTIKEFVEIIQSYGVQMVIDVRSVAKSSYVPKFNKDTFSLDLEIDGIDYVHVPELGGFNTAKKYSSKGWKIDGFKDYRKYMTTHEFDSALKKVLEISRDKRVVLMCSEGLPNKCHRSLIADALVARGAEVVHIISKTNAFGHVQRTLDG